MERNKTTVEVIKGHGRNPSGRRDGLILWVQPIMVP